MQDEWPQIVSLIRSYAARKYGQHAIGLSLHFQHGQEHREPFPLLPLPTVQTSALPPATSCPWASGDEPRMRGDGQRVYWPGLGVFTFSGKQRQVIKALWTAWEDGSHDVPQAALLAAADSDSPRLRDLFSRHPAWGTLIVRGGEPASYRLAPLPDHEEDLDTETAES